MKRRLIQLNTLHKLYQEAWLGEGYVSIPPPATVPVELPQNPGELGASITACHLCHLAKRRKQAAIGQGAYGGLMVVIDAPPAAQNERGSPFEGKSGVLLHRMISGGLGLDPASVYVTSLVKCHPYGQLPDAALEACTPFLAVELELVAPRAVLALGAQAFWRLSGMREPMERARGRAWPITLAPGVKAPLFASYSPAYLSLNPSFKRSAMADLKLVLEVLSKDGR